MLEMWEGALQVVLRVLIFSTRTFISRDLNYWVYCVRTLYKFLYVFPLVTNQVFISRVLLEVASLISSVTQMRLGFHRNL